jgi:hypothetical protein
LTKRWTRDSSYFCSATTVEFRFEGGGGTPLEELIRTYQYTGKSYPYGDYDVRYEYCHVDSRSGEKRYCDLQREKTNNQKIPKTITQRLRPWKRIHYYIGHYDAEKYRAQMVRYKQGEIKTRPNGRTWCLLSDTAEIRIIGDQWIKLDEYYRLMNHR